MVGSKRKLKDPAANAPSNVANDVGSDADPDDEASAFEFEFEPDYGALDRFFNEAVLFFHRITFAAEQIHKEGELTAGRRGVLRGIANTGPLTVPQMARARPVSRQHLQSLVNPLAEEGYVKFIENPAHKRSHLVALTEKGKQHLREHLEREADVMKHVTEIVSPDELRQATETIAKLNKYFQSPAWRRRLKANEAEGSGKSAAS